MTDPKLKNHAQTPSEFDVMGFFVLRHSEFLSPLPVKDCVRRLKRKAAGSAKSDTDLTADIMPISAGGDAFKFTLRRAVEDRNARGRLWVINVRVDGLLRFWDQDNTVVTCQPRVGWFPGWLTLAFGAFTLLMLVSAITNPPTDAEALRDFSLTLAISFSVFSVLLILRRLSAVEEHRRLMALVEDVLRYPITIEGSTIKHHTVDEYGIATDFEDTPEEVEIDWQRHKRRSS